MLKCGKPVVEFLRAGTRTAQGLVVWHDCTIYELGRLCIETVDCYPDLCTWLDVVNKQKMTVLLYHYTAQERKTGIACHLWLFYKAMDGRRKI